MGAERLHVAKAKTMRLDNVVVPSFVTGFRLFSSVVVAFIFVCGRGHGGRVIEQKKKTAHHRPAIRCEAIRIAYPDKRRHRDTSPFRRRRTWPSFASHATQLLRNAAPSEKRNEKKTATTKQTKNRRLGTGRGWASGGGGGRHRSRERRPATLTNQGGPSERVAVTSQWSNRD